MFRPPQQTPTSPASGKTALPRTILVVTPYYPSHGGNQERAVGSLIDEIGGSTDTHFTWAASNCDPAPAGPIITLPMRSANLMESWFGIRWPLWSRRSLRQLRRAMEGVDCLWLHDTLTLGSIRAFRMARKLSKPIFVTQHQEPASRTRFWRRAWLSLMDRYVTHFILKHARQVTFTSDAAAEFYYRRVAFTTPVKIIPNGVDCSLYSPCLPEKRNVLRARFALRDDQPVMLFVSDFTNEMGLSVVKHLAEMLPEWRFWLVGKGRTKPESWFLPNVQVFRSRRDEELAELYQSADLLLLPSSNPRFPLSAQEAMACGLPVLCSPAVAAANPFAKPYLWVVKTDPSSPEQTAKIWAKKLKSARSVLPISEAKTELSELAQTYWEWPNIAQHYAGIFKAITPSRAA